MSRNRRITFHLAFAVALLVLALPVAAQSPFVGVWQNQLGSYLVVQFVDPGTGQVSGYYVNYASGWSCIGSPYSVTGWAYANTITFSVLWKNSVANCNSQTAWTGFLSGGRISTRWNLVTTAGSWSNGSDTFTQVGATEHPSAHPDHQKP
jgi:hypothetical protein